MTIDAYAPEAKPPEPDPITLAFSRLVMTLGEDAMFCLAARPEEPKEALEGLGKRRTEAYAALMQGVRIPRLTDDFDRWVVEMSRAMAAVAPPAWMPMHEVLGEKVTLEAGARGLRSLFSSKPSDKDVQRVKRLGTMAVRVLRAVFAADGPIDHEEGRTAAAFIASLGLPDADAQPLYQEAPREIDQLDVYGDIEPAVAKAMLRGAWLAAAWDSVDPREEQVIRVLAQKLSLAPDLVEATRADALNRVEARRLAGMAVVDAVRFVLSDRVPGPGVQLAAHAGTLMLPRRYREEALAQVGHGAPVTLAKRFTNLLPEDRVAVLGMAWAAALTEDPTVSRRTLLRWRFDRFAIDMGDDGVRARSMIEEFVGETLAAIARAMHTPPR